MGWSRVVWDSEKWSGLWARLVFTAAHQADRESPETVGSSGQKHYLPLCPGTQHSSISDSELNKCE